MSTERTLGHLLAIVAIASTAIVLAVIFGVALRAQAINRVATEFERRAAIEAQLEDRARANANADDSTKAQILADATSELLQNALQPVPTGSWSLAAFLSYAFMAAAVLGASWWATSRTGLWQAGVGVALVAVAAWIVVVWAGAAKLHSLPAVSEALSEAAGAAGRRRLGQPNIMSRVVRQVFTTPELEWSTPLKAALLLAAPAWAGVSAGLKSAASRSRRHFFEPVAADSVAIAPPGTEAAQTPSAGSVQPGRPVARPVSWDPLDGFTGTESLAADGSQELGSTETHQQTGQRGLHGSHAGLCPRCGAVCSPRNDACLMCGADLPPA